MNTATTTIVALIALGVALAAWSRSATFAIETAAELPAPPEEVWEVLTDLDRYPDWNPFMVRGAGTFAPGERVEIDLRPPGGSGMTIRPEVRVAEPGAELRWLGSLGVPGVFDGEHLFVLTATADGGTHLRHAEDFRGVLVPVLWPLLGRRTEAGFHAMNAALAEQVAVAG